MILTQFQGSSHFFRNGLVAVLLLSSAWLFASGGEAESEVGLSPAENVVALAKAPAPPALFYAIAITMSVSCISAGYAVGKIGAAVMGAASEKPEVLGRAIAYVGLGEGIALFGFLISLFLIFQFA